MKKIGRVILEALIVAVVGVAFALFANSRYDKGLSISKDHFAALNALSESLAMNQSAADRKPAVDSRPTTQTAGETPAAGDETAPPADPGTLASPESESPAGEHSPAAEDSPVAQLIINMGFQPITHEEVIADFNDPRREVDAIVFVDARERDRYEAGHIPGARQLSHYRPEQTIDQVLPFLQGAEKVIVYCHGGRCEDSLLVAADLRDQYGIMPDKLYVYAGGIEQWRNDGQPVERGQRNSGDIIAGGAK